MRRELGPSGSPESFSTLAPISSSRRCVVPTSPSEGTLRYVEVPRASSDEASIGRAAFLAPEMRTSPLRRCPPRMRMRSTRLRRARGGELGGRFGLLALEVLLAEPALHHGLAAAFLGADLVARAVIL